MQDSPYMNFKTATSYLGWEKDRIVVASEKCVWWGVGLERNMKELSKVTLYSKS